MAEQELRADDSQLRQAESAGVSVQIKFNIARAVRVLYRHNAKPEGGLPTSLNRNIDGDYTVLAFDVRRLGATSLLASAVPLARDAAGTELKRWPALSTSIYPELPQRRFEARLPTAELPTGARLCVLLQHSDPGAPRLPDTEACLS
jgi:hypothetical protein